jgi:hypothetical protein
VLWCGVLSTPVVLIYAVRSPPELTVRESRMSKNTGVWAAFLAGINSAFLVSGHISGN